MKIKYKNGLYMLTKRRCL